MDTHKVSRGHARLSVHTGRTCKVHTQTLQCIPELEVGMLHGGQIVTRGGGLQVTWDEATASNEEAEHNDQKKRHMHTHTYNNK
eukprot:1161972-Pelagomonas_calceolata.AAC.10